MLIIGVLDKTTRVPRLYAVLNAAKVVLFAAKVNLVRFQVVQVLKVFQFLRA